MRGTLDEMRLRAERAQADADTARAEAAQAEVDAAALAKEIALLEVRQRSAGIPPGGIWDPPLLILLVVNGLFSCIFISFVEVRPLSMVQFFQDSGMIPGLKRLTFSKAYQLVTCCEPPTAAFSAPVRCDGSFTAQHPQDT